MPFVTPLTPLHTTAEVAVCARRPDLRRRSPAGSEPTTWSGGPARATSAGREDSQDEGLGGDDLRLALAPGGDDHEVVGAGVFQARRAREGGRAVVVVHELDPGRELPVLLDLGRRA